MTPLLALDTNVFIYHFEGNPEFGGAARAILDAAERGRVRIATSTLALLEILVVPKRGGRADLVTRYRHLFQGFPNLSVHPIDEAVAERAAELRAELRLRTPDAIHVATAQLVRADAFLTQDEGLLRLADRLPVLRLIEAPRRFTP
jgi:predicted nucleic acid-binding protein